MATAQFDVPGFFEKPEAALAFSEMPQLGTPETPGRARPDIVIDRDFFGDELTLPDGREVEYWGFDDPRGLKPYPSPLMRVRQGQIVHTFLHSIGQGAHTIHHHGIEPSDFNDGVGHTSFEVNGSYTYQWRPSQAGTFLYHCHVNTTLHFEMGLYGMLVVDPPGGPGRAFVGGPTYDVEALWTSGAIDPAKHELNQAAGLDGEDVGLNEWNPRYFHVNGAFHPQSRTSPKSAVNMRVGDALLVRFLNAGYYPQRLTFGGLTAQVVASDGRPLPRAYSVTEIVAGTTERYDCVLRPTAPGTYVARFEHLHWVTEAVVGVAEARITVS